MFLDRFGARIPMVDLYIAFDAHSPPSGRVVAELVPPTANEHRGGERGEVGVPFSGWLGLLKVLSDVLEAADES